MFALSVPFPCGESFNNTTEGTIYSPGWPGDYGILINCRWDIKAENGSIIRLTFQSFAVEYEDQCGTDHLMIMYNLGFT